MPRVSPNCIFGRKIPQRDEKIEEKTGRNLAPWVYFQTQKELWIEKIAGIFYDDGYFSSRAKNASPSIRTAFPGFSPVTISPKRKVNQLQRIYFL